MPICEVAVLPRMREARLPDASHQPGIFCGNALLQQVNAIGAGRSSDRSKIFDRDRRAKEHWQGIGLRIGGGQLLSFGFRFGDRLLCHYGEKTMQSCVVLLDAIEVKLRQFKRRNHFISNQLGLF